MFTLEAKEKVVTSARPHKAIERVQGQPGKLIRESVSKEKEDWRYHWGGSPLWVHSCHLQPALLVHTCNPSTVELRQEDLKFGD